MRSPAKALRSFTARSSGHSSSNYYFRRVVPRDLRGAFGGRREFRLSLRTADRDLAYGRWLVSTARWVMLVSLARRLKDEGKHPRFEGVASLLKYEASEPLLPFASTTTYVDRPREIVLSFAARAPHAEEPLLRTNTAASLGIRAAVSAAPLEIRTFADVAREFIEERSCDWTQKTRHEIEATLGLFAAALGAVPFRDIDRAALRDVRMKLQKFPRGWKKSPIFRHLTFNEALARQAELERKGKARPVMAATVNKWWDSLRALYQWAVANKDTNANYAVGLKVRERRSLGRRSFTDEELQRIFSSRLFAPGGYSKPAHYWGPVLSMYTGARCNELAQVPLVAIHRDAETGVVWIDINPELGFVLKNGFSQRELPIHGDIANDFWKYVELLHSHSETFLFPELPRGGRDGPGRYLSEYVNDHLLRAAGVKSPQLVLHSFRHSFIQRLEAAGVEDKWVRRLVGHCGTNSLAIYGGRPQHNVLFAKLQQAAFPVMPPPFCRKGE